MVIRAVQIELLIEYSTDTGSGC